MWSSCTWLQGRLKLYSVVHHVLLRCHAAGAEVWHMSCERYLAQMQSGGSPPRDQSSPAVGRDAAVQQNGEKLSANGETKKEQQSKVPSLSPKFENSKSSDSPLGKFARSDTCKPFTVTVVAVLHEVQTLFCQQSLLFCDNIGAIAGQMVMDATW